METLKPWMEVLNVKGCLDCESRRYYEPFAIFAPPSSSLQMPNREANLTSPYLRKESALNPDHTLQSKMTSFTLIHVDVTKVLVAAEASHF